MPSGVQGFWLLAFGFWLLALGSWLSSVSILAYVIFTISTGLIRKSN